MIHVCNRYNCEWCGDGGCEVSCDPDNYETCVDGECKVCGGDPTKCCYDGECKDCCKDSARGYCEAFNNGCGCDPIGLMGCADKQQTMMLGVAHDCWSECGGTPCNCPQTSIDCYVWWSCKTAGTHWDSLCIDTGEYCEGIIPIGFCQDCMQDGVGHVVEAYDYRCH